MRRVLFYLTLGIFLISTGYLAFMPQIRQDKPKRGSGGSPTSVAVEVSPVIIRDLEDEGKFSGSLIPKIQFTVVPKISGRLKKLNCDVGDRLKKDQPIAEIEDEEFVQAVVQAEAELAIARASVKESEALLETARRENDRVKAMRLQKVSSDVEVEASLAQLKSREAKHEVSKAQILQKEAALQSTKIRLSYTRLNASWIDNSAGYHVAERFQNVGAMLSPNTPIVSIYDLATITAIVEIVERDYYRMKTGQVVQITTGAIPNKAFFGIVARISPFLSSSTRQGRVEIEISNQDFALKPGMFVIAKVKYMSKAAVTAVPITALARRENTEGVFWVDTQRSVACFLPVEKGIIQSDLVEVSSPTISGFVVTLGQHLLEDGTSIDLPGEKENNRETQSERKRGSREGGKKSERGKGKE